MVSTLDVIVGLVIVSSGSAGFLRGFSQEVLGVAAWIVASFAALYGLAWVRPFASDILPWTWMADAVTAMVIFLVVLVLLTALSRIVSGMIRKTLFSTLDHSLGFFFGLVRGATVVFLTYMLVEFLMPSANQPAWMREAGSVSLMQCGTAFFRSVVPDALAGKASH
ncbi:Colicin V production protein [invertebrate metagenome]|uniref:Colicin V production protein n=1 Tax=invertebrate metagenome TaxID=1711999 RepID=A0A484H6X7_9ZZZZ